MIASLASLGDQSPIGERSLSDRLQISAPGISSYSYSELLDAYQGGEAKSEKTFLRSALGVFLLKRAEFETRFRDQARAYERQHLRKPPARLSKWAKRR
jgi:hypothetical protein